MAATFNAAFMTAPGHTLSITAVEAHHARPGEVVIKVQAVALQPLDAKMLIAGYGPASQLDLPAVLGTSGAGLVQELGEGVDDFEVGDRVVFDTAAYVRTNENRRTGTWQQSVVCDAQTVAKVGFEAVIEWIRVSP
jgi:NADPH:quinone reductase-like Zn-dependent oxidoreductase